MYSAGGDRAAATTSTTTYNNKKPRKTDKSNNKRKAVSVKRARACLRVRVLVWRGACGVVNGRKAVRQ